MLLPLFEEFSANSLRDQFQALTSKDIKLKLVSHSPYQSQYKVRFKDKSLNKPYARLMEQDFDESDTTVDVERDNLNRLHLNAIPESLRGIGLGRKIYEALLRSCGMISCSVGNSSESAQRVWDSLVSSQKYAYFHDEKHERRVLTLKKYERNYHPQIDNWFNRHGRSLYKQ